MIGRYLVLFAILFTGYFLRKINFLDDEMNHGLNKFIVYFAYPCMIVHNIGTLEMTGQLAMNFIVMLLLSLAFFYLYGGYMYLYGKARKFPRDISNVAEFASASPNNGFMGFPITLLFFGEKGMFLMLAHNSAMNFFFFTYGIKALRRNRSKAKTGTESVAGGDGDDQWAGSAADGGQVPIKHKAEDYRAPSGLLRSVLKVATNPNTIALVLGLVLSISGTGLPGPIDEYLVYIGGVSTPMAMIYIGSTLAQFSFLEIIKDRVTIEGSINKLIILPLLTVALVYFLPIDDFIKAMLVMGCAFPGAAVVSMLTQQEGQDATVSSKILFLSTVVSIVTIPLAVELINLIWM